MPERNGRCGLMVRTGALVLGVASASGFASAETRGTRSVSACVPTSLTMSSWVPPTHHLTNVVLQGFAAEVEQASGGRLQFRMLPKHPVPAPATFDAVRDGLVDLSF